MPLISRLLYYVFPYLRNHRCAVFAVPPSPPTGRKMGCSSFSCTAFNLDPVLLPPHVSAYNAPSFRAGTQLLSSLSGYAYTKRAWKKEVLELFLDPAFFQMDTCCTQ